MRRRVLGGGNTPFTRHIYCWCVTGREQPKLGIVEDNPDGHRLMYVARLFDYARRAGMRPVIVCSQAARDSVEYDLHLMSEFPFILWEDHSLPSLAELGRREGFTQIVVPDGDYLLPVLARRARWASEIVLTVLVMREFGQSGPILRRAAATGVKRMRVLIANTRASVRVKLLRPASRQKRGMLPSVPDHAELSTTGCLDSIGAHKPDGEFWVGVFGAITARKQLPLLLEGLSTNRDSSVRLVIGGRLDEFSKAAVESFTAENPLVAERIVLKDRLLTDAELDALILATDAVVISHLNRGPSGIMAKAMLAGTHLIIVGDRNPDRYLGVEPGRLIHARPGALGIAEAIDLARETPAPDPLVIPKDSFASALIGPMKAGSSFPPSSTSGT